jgi:DNA polymerase I-like protein with 3'-5' exonuclease and polymerase domains
LSTTKAKKDLHEDQYHMMQFAGRGGWGDATAGNWSPPSGYPDLSDSKYLAVDLETRDPNLRKLGPGWTRKDGYVIGIAVSNGAYSAYYPIRHEGGGNLPEKATLRWLAKQMATPNVPKVFHNALYDLGWLRAEGIEVQGRIIDTMIAAPLLDENRWSYSLNALGGHYLKEYKNERNMTAFAKQMGIDPKADMWRMPADVVGEYAEQDAALTLRLWQRLEAELIADECTAIFDLETSLIPTLFEMKTRGVRVDVDRADVVRKDLQNREKGLLKKVKDETGVLIEPWVATSIAKAFDAVGLSYPTTDNSNAPSFTKQFLTSHEHPLAQWIVKLREYNKANTTFIETILEHSHNGRIHCDFNQLRSDEGGTVTGRFSSSNPNLQQIPARDPEIKAMIRGLFLPEEGTKWGSFDYASQEPRWLAHYCARLKNPHPAVEGVVKMYHEGNADFHQMVADLAGISRKEAKTVNLGIMYGMGRGKLATVMDLTDEEAKSLLAQYHDKVPFVKGIADQVSRYAERFGLIRTWLGRKCRFDMWEPKSYGYNKPLPAEEAAQEYGGKGMIRRAFTYKALNKLIQGSSADQTKKAMVDCANEGMLPMLTVHDELCFSVEDESQANKIVDIMSNCVPDLKVPFEVDAELGANWGEVG